MRSGIVRGCCASVGARVRHRLQYVGVRGPELFGGVFRMCSCSNVFGRVSGIIRCCSDVFESGTPPHQCVCHCRNQRYTHVTNHTDDNHTHTSRTTGAHEPWHSHVTIGLAEPKRSPLGPGRATSNTSRYVMSMQRCAGVSLARTRNATWHMSCYTLSVREHVAIPHTQTRFNSDLAYNLECQSNLRHDSGSTP
jgi:hypothetical protein